MIKEKTFFKQYAVQFLTTKVKNGEFWNAGC